MTNNLKPLLSFYDAFGWIPTIRGALSLDLMGEGNKIWGDVDRYAVSFVNYNDTISERYIAATSLHNVSDSKYGKDFIRTFRYFFYASIHNKTDGDNLIREIEGKIKDEDVENIRNIIENEGVLIGHLVIVLEETSNLTEREVRIIKAIKNLIPAKELYSQKFYIEADSLENLAAIRSNMKRDWESVKNEISNLVNDEKPQFEFDVLLTRDGILLLKDCTISQYKTMYCVENSESDYTKKIPLHRIFKTAMNFMKYLFHTNYHHEEEHDTFLPASNLHPYRKNFNFSRIFKHQIDAYLNPLMKIRRNGMKTFNVDPVGILHYSKSFVYSCQNNNLIDREEASCQLDYIKLLEEETNHLNRHQKSLLGSLATQRNLFFIITTILAFAVALLKITESSLRISGSDGKILGGFPFYFTILALLGICILGYVLFEISHHQITKREFHIHRGKLLKNKLRSKIFHHDSDLKNGKLSLMLRRYMWIQNKWYDICNNIGKKEHNTSNGKFQILIAKIIFWSILALAIIYSIYKLLSNLIANSETIS